MKKWYVVFVFLISPLLGNEIVKKAFSEGIKASVNVVKYEKDQADKEIPSGYCIAIIGKEKPLDIWEEVKLESLALFLKLDPSLLLSEKSSQRVLCLSIKEEKEEALKVLKKIAKQYPKIEEYITKVEILPSTIMHRVIPGIGILMAQKAKIKPEIAEKTKIDIPLNGRVVLLDNNKKFKVMFENGSTRVVTTALRNILYIEHTVYHRKIQ